jgi:uncharacterized protein (TIGR03437 family)
MSLGDLAIQRSINVAAQPGSLALSPDGRYLLVAHYGNFQAPNSPNNALTLIDLSTNSRQTFGMGAPPLGVAFGIDGRALVATSTEFLLFDPATGGTRQLDTVPALTAKILPQPPATAPTQIVATSMAVSGDGVSIFGVTGSFYFRYDSQRGFLRAGGYSSSPTLGPRAVSVSTDGTYWISGWTLNDPDFWVISQFPNASGDLNVGSVQIDSQRNLVYAQIAQREPATTTPAPAGQTTTTATTSASGPVLMVAYADNLTVRERLKLAENLSGKSVMSSDGAIMYSVSESGVTVLPVGMLNREPRIFASKQQLMFRGNFCDRSIATQEITLQSDGGPADFRITSDTPGVRVSPTVGTAPATVRVSVDPSAFSSQKGTAIANLKIESSRAVNQIASVRVMVNSKEPDQRGSMVPVGGKIVDLIADPQRDRFFLLRQDTNEVLVYDGATLTETARLRTYNTPMSMTITFDRRWLLVACDNSHLINIYDLETLQPERPIRVGDYPQSIAASANAILTATRSASGGDNKIHRVDLGGRITVPLATLGVFENRIARDTVVAASGNGRYILIAQADGNLMLYDGSQDTFTVSRKESTPLTGAFAASNFDKFVVGNALLNSSLVPERRFETESGKPAGFAFVDNQVGFRITAPSQTAPGVLARVDLGTGNSVRPTRTFEAPVLASTDQAFTRTLAPLYSRQTIIALTASGFTAFPWDYDTATVPPRIDRIVNAADPSQSVAPGGLVSVLGNDLSPVSQSTRQVPLPTALGETCLLINGQPVPMMLVSPQRINAQLPFGIEGMTAIVLRTPGGVSDTFNVAVQPAAPSVFRTGVAGPQSDIPTVIRAENGELVTLSNPVHRGDALTVFAASMGATNPSIDAGVPAPTDLLTSVIIPPVVTLGGVPVEVTFAGLAPNEIGVYQINVQVYGNVPTGMEVPLVIRQGGAATTIPVRVVN